MRSQAPNGDTPGAVGSACDLHGGATLRGMTVSAPPETTIRPILPEDAPALAEILRQPSVARWWGTDGQRNEITAFDFRPGGKWRIVSHEPDGKDYIFIGEYREIVEPEKFVWTFGMENMFFGKTLVETHTFEEDGAITHYRSVSNYDSIEDRDGMVAAGMEIGMRHGFEVMDRILAELTQDA